MPWFNHSILLLLLLATTAVESKFGGLPDKIKNIAVRSHSSDRAEVEWKCYENDIISYNVQIIDASGREENRTIEPNPPDHSIFPCLTPDDCSYYLPSSQYAESFSVGANETYTVRVSAVNKQGEGPSSLDIIFHNGPDKWQKRSLEYPDSPNNLWIKWYKGNRVKLGWTKSEIHFCDENCPIIEYTVHYRDISGSDWNTLKTNNTWMILEDLQNGTVYNAYVQANGENKTTPISPVIPILLDDPEETGLPEPVITINPVVENGPLIAVNCSLPQNFNMHYVKIKISFGKDVIKVRDVKPYGTLYTLTDSGTVECEIKYVYFSREPHRLFGTQFDLTRSASRVWDRKMSAQYLDDEYLQRRLEEVEVDRKRMSRKRI